jgi:hypothetical protein
MPFAVACMVSAALCSVTPLGIPDLLKHGLKSTQELARTCAAHEDGVDRVPVEARATDEIAGLRAGGRRNEWRAGKVWRDGQGRFVHIGAGLATGGNAD